MVMLIGWGILAVPTGIVTAEMTVQQLGTRGALRCSACGAGGHDADAAFCRRCGAPLS
jgi:voltage-gated potassium channel